MLTRRWGTLVVLVVWVASWGLVFVHGLFALVPLTPVLVAVMAAPLIAEDNYDPDFKPKFDFVFLPLVERHVRHNTRARLERRIAALAEGKRACQELIETATEEEATRIPVLEAERDAAEREIVRLRDDIRRLEDGWEREDRERKYKELVG